MLGARSWVLAVSLTLGCRAGAFACADANDCAAAGDAGVCQADGWCSFPTDECPSGQRYGEHAGDGLAGACVDGTEGTSTSATTSDQTSTLDTTVTETSLVTSDADTTMTASSTVADTSASGRTTDDTATTGVANVCGDGIVEDDEECDLGDSNGNGSHCRDDCMMNVCGDGYLGPGEQCEADFTEACSEECLLVTCGDGEVGLGEECDPLAPIPGNCQNYGFVDGKLECTALCSITTSACEGCGEDGCQFPPCNDACPAGEHCVSYLDGEVCTAVCETDEECASDIPGVLCENGECVIPCEFEDDCPLDMMACFNGQCAYAANP